jgi:superfamily II DNA or RNA helicase
MSKLTRRGYVLRKDRMSAADIRTVRKDLLVSPFNPVKQKMLEARMKWDPSAEAADDAFKVYQENAAKFYLPPFYAIEKFGAPDTNELETRGTPIDLLFHGSMRLQQQDVAEVSVAHLRRHGGGILQLRCGFGKTIIALHLFARLKVKVLVLVHKEFLMNQWRERIAQFLPDAKVGTLQAKTVDVEGRDIVIGMLQSVAVGKYPEAVYADFGLCCFDECHHLGAQVFSKALGIARTRYMLGLSATPDRKDRLRKVFDWQLGKVMYKVEAKVSQHVYVEVVPFADPKVETNPGGTLVLRHQGRALLYDEKPTFRAKLLAYLVGSDERMRAIMACVVPYAANPKRRILVLSERRKHLEDIGAELEAAGIAHGFYWGGVKQKALDEAAEKQVVLGTYHMASEGMDIPCLNTVLLASPKSDVKQSVGRILRRTDHEVVPTIIDFVDTTFPCFSRQLNVRKRLYAECGFAYTKEAAPTSTSTSTANQPTSRKKPNAPGTSTVLAFRTFA